MKGLDINKIIDEMNRVSELMQYEDEFTAGYVAGYRAAILQLFESYSEMIDDDLSDNEPS